MSVYYNDSDPFVCQWLRHRPEERMSHVTLLRGNALLVLPTLPAESVHCVVTSPPYWGLRDYGLAPQLWGGEAGCAHEWDVGTFCRRCGAWRGSLGLEPTPELYVEHLVAVFREVRRVLRKDGTLWLNMGDCYANGDKRGYAKDRVTAQDSLQRSNLGANFIGAPNRLWNGLAPKQLVGMPWRVAFALQADGWWLRAEIIWAKPNSMPESVTDRPTRAHEYIFLLARSERYFYDAAAIAEPASEATHARISQASLDEQRGGFKQELYKQGFPGQKNRDRKPVEIVQALARKFDRNGRTDLNRNARTVWEISTQPYPEAHFATFPEELARRCILAGSSHRACEQCGAPWRRIVEATGGTIGRAWHDHADDERVGQRRENMANGTGYQRMEKGWEPTCKCEGNTGSARCTVLDPFGGSGTVAQVATGNGRDGIYIDLKPEYLELARQRIGPLLAGVLVPSLKVSCP